MRVLTLPDGSRWTLQTYDAVTESAKRRRGGRRRRVSRARTFVWVRCISGGVERRLMFAATWDLWTDEQLASASAAALDSRAWTDQRTDRSESLATG